MNNDDKKLVYLLQYAPMDTVLDDFIYDQIKYIGIYESIECAQLEIAKLIKKSGFNEQPNDFIIDPYELNRTGWEEGFFTYYYKKWVWQLAYQLFDLLINSL